MIRTVRRDIRLSRLKVGATFPGGVTGARTASCPDASIVAVCGKGDIAVAVYASSSASKSQVQSTTDFSTTTKAAPSRNAPLRPHYQSLIPTGTIGTSALGCAVRDMALSQSGTRLVVAGVDGTLSWWMLSTSSLSIIAAYSAQKVLGMAPLPPPAASDGEAWREDNIRLAILVPSSQVLLPDCPCQWC